MSILIIVDHEYLMMATIENLPEELMFKIFSHYIQSEGHEKFLRNIPRVCKKWNKLSTEAPLWKDVFVRDSEFLQHLSQRGLLYNTQSLAFGNERNFYEMNLSPVLENIRNLKALDLGINAVGSNVVKLVTENCPHLQLLHLDIPESTTSHELDQFLTVCGPTLKYLHLDFFGSQEEGQQLVSGIAAKCPILETLRFEYTRINKWTPFPIYELQSRCPRMRELRFWGCKLIEAERKDSSLGCGFRELKKFTAKFCDFNGGDVYFLLKDSVHLECLKLYGNDNLIFGNISKISSDKVRILGIQLKYPDENFKALGDAVFKWRRTLTHLNLWCLGCDVSSILECYLEDNQNPQIKALDIGKKIDLRFLQEFIQKCRNLIRLKICGKEYEGREKIEEALELLVKGKKLCLGT